MITSYNRTDHLRGLLNSIAESRYARDLEINIFLDGKKSLSDKLFIDSRLEQKSIIKSFRSVFKVLNVIERSENLGSSANADKAIEGLFENGHESLLILEDDIEVSPLLFEFIKTWHNIVLHTQNAYSISGMCSFFRSKSLHSQFEGSIVISSIASLHAYVIYKKKYIRPGLISFRKKTRLLYVLLRLLRDAPVLVLFIVDMKYLHRIYGDVLITLRSYYRDQVNISPVSPMIIPKGYDATGENCRSTNKYDEFASISGYSKTNGHKSCQPLRDDLMRDYLGEEFNLKLSEYLHLLKRSMLIILRSAERVFVSSKKS